MRPSPAPLRSRTRGARTQTGPRPVTILRSGRCPWRTRRWRPSSVCLSAWPARKAATSASTACASSARAPSRKTSVSGSEKAPGWTSSTTLPWVTAYHSFGGEVEARTPPRGAYTVDQEAVTADEKETDIRLRSTVSSQQGTIELKLADERSGRDLFDTLRDQLL